MKDRIFIVAAMSCLLGIYSASIYHFSLDDIHENLHSVQSLPEASTDVEDLEKIMRAVRVQVRASPGTNLPVPGAHCALTLEDLLEDTASPISDEISLCLGTPRVALDLLE